MQTAQMKQNSSKDELVLTCYSKEGRTKPTDYVPNKFTID